MKGKGQRADLQKNARCYKSILQSSGYYPYVAQAQTAIPALPSYNEIWRVMRSDLP